MPVRDRPPLEVPLEGESLLHQIIEVLAEDELVRLVVLELAADEEDPGSANHRAYRQKVQVGATGCVIRREVVLVQRVLEDQVIGIGFVRGQEYQRVILAQLVQLLKFLARVVQVVVAETDDPSHEAGDGVDHKRGMRRCDLLEVAPGALPHRLHRHVFGVGERGDALLEAPASKKDLAEELGHLVPRPA